MSANSAIGILVALSIIFTAPCISAHDPCSGQPQLSSRIQVHDPLPPEFEELPELAESQVLLSINPVPVTQFGYNLTLSGELLAVASRNWFGDQKSIVDLYRYESGAWQRIKSLESPVNQAYEAFRVPVIEKEKLLVGAPGYCSTGENGYCEEGTVWVFDRNEGGPDNWGLVQQLDGGFKRDASFGNGIAVDENNLVVFAPGEYPPGTENSGVLYIFERATGADGDWSLVKRIESDGIWDQSWAYSDGGIYLHGETLLVNGHDSTGMVIKEFQRDAGGAANWGFVQQIRMPRIRLNSGDFDGETLMLHLQDDCVPEDERQHWLNIYSKNDLNNWALQREMEIPRESRGVAMDGSNAILASDAAELGYLLERSETPGSWTVNARLVLAESPGPYSEPHPGVALDAGRAVIGAPYASYITDREGFAVAYEIADPINPGHAGAWFNPNTSGQGQFLDVVPAKQYMFLSWFTFMDDDDLVPREQHWYTAQGRYTGNKAELTLYETLGGRFDDPQAVATNAIGELTVRFSDCGYGEISYRFDDERSRPGFAPMYRVIPGSGNLCVEQTQPTPQSMVINRGMDGAWFDPDTSGQGYFFDVHTTTEGDDFFMLSWFTYGDDTVSGQRWLTAQGGFDSPTAILNVYETTGGSFNQPATVDTVKVGTVAIDFTDCESAHLAFSLDDDSLVGEDDLMRVIPGGEAMCAALAGMD